MFFRPHNEEAASLGSQMKSRGATRFKGDYHVRGVFLHLPRDCWYRDPSEVEVPTLNVEVGIGL